MFILVILVGLVSLACWIMVLIKMFSEGVVKGILGLICPLWAFIWGWMNSGEVGMAIMGTWTACIAANIALRVLMGSGN